MVREHCAIVRIDEPDFLELADQVAFPQGVVHRVGKVGLPEGITLCMVLPLSPYCFASTTMLLPSGVSSASEANCAASASNVLVGTTTVDSLFSIEKVTR